MASSMPRIIAIALIPVLVSLSACAIPPAVTIISLAANAVSYAATGKSVSDHGISAVVGEDCALWRVLADRKICTTDSAVLASTGSSHADEQAPKTLANNGIDERLSDPAEKVAAAPKGSAEPGSAEERPLKGLMLTDSRIDDQPSKPAHEAATLPKAGRFLVLGSFIDRTNAQHLVASLPNIETVIVTVDLKGVTFNRVVAGPLSDIGVQALRERRALEDTAQPWEIAMPVGQSSVAANPTATPATQIATAPLPIAASVIAADPPRHTRNTASIDSRD